MKLFSVEIHGDPNAPSPRRNAVYQIMAETAPDAFIAAMQRWIAQDRSSSDIYYVTLSTNTSEIIQVEGEIDLSALELATSNPS